MFKKIGSNFSINHILDMDKLKSLPEVFHEYGDSFVDVPTDRTVWMTYKRGNGSISFTRNTKIQFPEISEFVVNYLKEIIDIPIILDRVHILRTIGTVEPHRDEAGRNCCINIGLLNSNSATTKVSNKDDFSTFYNHCINFHCEDGNAYLLNTQKIHAVIGSDIERYLVTYGFAATYDQVLSKVKL